MTTGIEFDLNGMPFDSAAPPEKKPDAKPESHTEGGAVEVTSTEDLGLQAAAEAAFAPPRSPYEYRLDDFGDGEPGDVEAELLIRQTLFSEGIPTFAGNVLYETMQRLTRDGAPDEAALASSHAGGMAELERRHGADAKQIIGDAQAVTRRLCERCPGFAELLEDTGAGNDVHLIETLARVAHTQRGYSAKRGKA